MSYWFLYFLTNVEFLVEFLAKKTQTSIWIESRQLISLHLILSEVIKLFKESKNFNRNKSPTRCNNFSVYYPDVYLQLNMFRAFSHPSSGAQWLQWQPLVSPSYRGDTRAVFVGGPETCWAVNKRQHNKLKKLLHPVGDLFELYDDARTCLLHGAESFLRS